MNVEEAQKAQLLALSPATVTGAAREAALAALTAVLVAAEVPNLVTGLREIVAEAQAQQPDLEARVTRATEDEAAKGTAHEQAHAALRITPYEYRQRQAAEQAVATAGKELGDARLESTIAQNALQKCRNSSRLAEQKIAALEALPAPDPDVLRILRGK